MTPAIGTDSGESASLPPDAIAHDLQARARRRSRLFVGAVIVVAVLVVGVGLFAGAQLLLPHGHHVQGVIALSGDPGDTDGSWNSCEGTGGYDDFQPGMSASMKDGHGDVVGSLRVTNINDEQLRAFIAADKKYGLGGWGGDFDAAKDVIKSSADSGILCMLYVEGDVEDTDYYTFTFSHRGDINFSKSEMTDSGWWLSTSLGN